MPRAESARAVTLIWPPQLLANFNVDVDAIEKKQWGSFLMMPKTPRFCPEG